MTSCWSAYVKPTSGNQFVFAKCFTAADSDQSVITRLKTLNVIRLSTNRLIMVPDLDRLAQAAGQENSRI